MAAKTPAALPVTPEVKRGCGKGHGRAATASSVGEEVDSDIDDDNYIESEEGVEALDPTPSRFKAVHAVTTAKVGTVYHFDEFPTTAKSLKLQWKYLVSITISL